MQKHTVLSSQTIKNYRKSKLLFIGLVTCVLMLVGDGSRAYADTSAATSANDVTGQRKAYGLVEEKASNSIIGHWTISERLYLVTSHTKFDNDSQPEVGDCVEVKYYGHASVRIAKKISIAEADLCLDDNDADDGDDNDGDDNDGDDNNGDDNDGDDNNGDDNDGDDNNGDDGEEDEMPQEIEEIKGLIESMPDDMLVGAWMIDGIKYVTTDDTKFKQDEGSLVTGACVEINYSGSAAPFSILKIETEEPEDCMEPGTVVVPPSGDTFKDYGRIEALPDDPNLLGEWTINGVNYLVTNATYIRRWYGNFTVGTCVKVRYYDGKSPFVAQKIQTSKRHNCGGDDDDQGFARGMLFGQIRDFPETLSGEWNVGGMTFIASTDTNFNQSKGDFGEGVTVKVKFYVDDEGLQQATEIKTMFRRWQGNGSGDSGGDNDYSGAQGHAFGTVESFPAALVGEWVIGGIDYVATVETIFNQNVNAFAEEGPVRVRYYTNEAGERVATQIKATTGTTTIPGRHKLCGFIKQIPAFGFAGDWSVDGVDLFAEESADFEETATLLGLGAYAEIEYGIRNGRRYVHKIKGHVPPGGGLNNLVGTLTRRAGFSTQVAAASIDAEYENWEIGGRSYLITPATDLDEEIGELFVGNTVAVNSYTDADGNEVATRINTVTAPPATFMDQFLFLPLINR